MEGEALIQITEALDRLDHTRFCLLNYVAENKKCHCGYEDIREAIMKYQKKLWEERREF